MECAMHLFIRQPQFCSLGRTLFLVSLPLLPSPACWKSYDCLSSSVTTFEVGSGASYLGGLYISPSPLAAGAVWGPRDCFEDRKVSGY